MSNRDNVIQHLHCKLEIFSKEAALVIHLIKLGWPWIWEQIRLDLVLGLFETLTGVSGMLSLSAH